MDYATDDFGMWPGRAFVLLNAAIGCVLGFVIAVLVEAPSGGSGSLGKATVLAGCVGGLIGLMIVSANGIFRWHSRRRRRRQARPDSRG